MQLGCPAPSFTPSARESKSGRLNKNTISWSCSHVLFAIDLASQRVNLCGISADPSATWIHQVARDLTHPDEGFLRAHRYLIIDRDPLFTREFRALLDASGVKSVRLPARSPNLNAFAERFVVELFDSDRDWVNAALSARGALLRYLTDCVRFAAARPHDPALLSPLTEWSRGCKPKVCGCWR